MSKIILTGDRPTGRLHLGHYVGSLKRRVELQNSGAFDKIFIMIADAQALTDNADNPEKIRQNIIEVALDYLSVGIEPEKSDIFIQSQIPQLTELTFYYMNLVTVSRLQRNPTVKNEILMRNFEDDRLVSIVVPVYNAERFIGETIQYVKAQTYENWELILVDDCSKDNSCNVIEGRIREEKQQGRDNRIRLVRQETNSGAAKCRNKGISCAR